MVIFAHKICDRYMEGLMLRLWGMLVVGLIGCASSAMASSGVDTCGSCVVPCAQHGDGTFSVRLTGGRVDPPHVFSHVIRDTVRVGRMLRQAYTFSWLSDTGCRDTVILAEHAETLVMGLTLGKTPPLYVPIRPIAEYDVNNEPRAPLNFVELAGMLAYGGRDTSQREVGFSSLYYGVEALVAPFGNLFGDRLALALGGGIFFERGRMRIPVMGHLRYSFTSTTVKEQARFIPAQCAFSCEPLSDTIAAPEGAVRRAGPDTVDRAAILVHERVATRDAFAPYIFAEGGPIFNGPFEGAGPRPSLNPEDYGQWFAGAGAGIGITPWLHAQLAYRFTRLNVRTPCEFCTDVYQVNTNAAHAVLLRIALHWGWE